MDDAPSRPLNVEQIVKKAQSYDYNPHIPLKYWLRTAATLIKEADIYEREGNEQQTYLLLFRHAQLVLRNLSTHSEVHSTEIRAGFVQAERDVQKGLAKLEVLKPRINKRFQRYEQLVKERDARKPSSPFGVVLSASDAHSANNDHKQRRLVLDPATAGAKTLPTSQNKELAVRVANKELERRALARKATRQAGIPEEVEHERRGAGVWGDWEEALINDVQGHDQHTLSEQMQNIRLKFDATKESGVKSRSTTPSFKSSYSTYNYPTVPETSTTETWLSSPISEDTSHDDPAWVDLAAPLPPKPPPKNDGYSAKINPPPRPDKLLFNAPESPIKASDGLFSAYAEPIGQAPTFEPSAYLENDEPLRTVFLPVGLRESFLSIARPNTRANLETLGLLCGTLIRNAYFISKLVIPDQTSTSDTCDTVNEEKYFEYVDGEDLIVLGWIHTHPTQTCFMSSRDLHSHYGYQVQLAESIAMVCAPSKGDWGVFRLTDPPGMRAVRNCTQTGLFHPHAESDIYTEALRPGHVTEVKGLQYGVVDLRSTSL